MNNLAKIDFGNDPPRSQSSLAYASIRRDIIRSVLTPGAKLKIAELSAGLGVSPGATREALSRLISERLVVSKDQKGFAVAPLSIEDLDDLTDLRCEIEEIALRRSLDRGGLQWEAGLIAAAHQLRGMQRLDDDEPSSLSESWTAQHAAFHHALVAACGSKRLLVLHAQLFEQSERYRGLSVHVGSHRTVNSEHDEIVEAALARDADLLVARTKAHMLRTTDNIKKSSGQLVTI